MYSVGDLCVLVANAFGWGQGKVNVCDPTVFPVLFAVGMFVAALNAKALGVTIAFCLGLLAVYPDCSNVGIIVGLYIPAVVLASFRE